MNTLEQMFPAKYEWRCETCGTSYAEYVNGCPRCWEHGIRSKVASWPEEDDEQG